jgi:tRNA (guanine-N7-)-methyltransferase
MGFIGAEPFINGAAAAAARIEENGLQSRIRLHADDVTPLLSRLPQASLGRAFMLFPDPWPKKRHRQRRLLSAAFLDRLAVLLKDGAEFRFASDSEDYATAARALAEANPAFELAQLFTSAERDTVADWPVTRYEKKAANQGRSAMFLIFRRKPHGL